MYAGGAYKHANAPTLCQSRLFIDHTQPSLDTQNRSRAEPYYSGNDNETRSRASHTSPLVQAILISCIMTKSGS